MTDRAPPLVTDGIAGAQTHAALRGQRSPKMLSQTGIVSFNRNGAWVLHQAFNLLSI